VRALLYSLF